MSKVPGVRPEDTHADIQIRREACRSEVSTFFMNRSSAWTIHEPEFLQMQDMADEAVVYHRKIRHNEADGRSWVRPNGEECRLIR